VAAATWSFSELSRESLIRGASGMGSRPLRVLLRDASPTATAAKAASATPATTTFVLDSSAM